MHLLTGNRFCATRRYPFFLHGVSQGLSRSPSNRLGKSACPWLCLSKQHYFGRGRVLTSFRKRMRPQYHAKGWSATIQEPPKSWGFCQQACRRVSHWIRQSPSILYSSEPSGGSSPAQCSIYHLLLLLEGQGLRQGSAVLVISWPAGASSTAPPS